MIRKGTIKGIFLAVWMLALCMTPVSVYAESRIYDGADLLDSDERDTLAGKVSSLEEKSGWEIFILTTDDAEGKAASEYSEEFLNDHLAGDDGIVYTIDMDNREVYLATTGNAIYYLTDERIDRIIDSGYDKLKAGKYGGCFSEMLTATQNWYEEGIPSDQYTYDTDTGEIVPYKKPLRIEWYEALIALALAAAAFAGVFVSVVGKYRLKWGTYKYDYHANSRINLKNKQDIYVNKVVTHRHIPQNNSSGSSSGGGSGRSSVHSGAGGRSYGGGGRSF